MGEQFSLEQLFFPECRVSRSPEGARRTAQRYSAPEIVVLINEPRIRKELEPLSRDVVDRSRKARMWIARSGGKGVLSESQSL